MPPLAAPLSPPLCAAHAQLRAAPCRRAALCTPARARRSPARPRASAGAPPEPAAPPAEDAAAPATADAAPPASGSMPRDKARAALGKGVNLFDPAATVSRFLTRRFGIVGGLAFVAVLASTEGVEIVKALKEELTPPPPPSGKAVTLPSGVSYVDTKIGLGASPQKGDFVGMHLRVTGVADGAVYLDTRAAGRPIAFVYRSTPRPPVCVGLEMGLADMRRGGARVITVPAALGPYAGADPALAGPPLAPGAPRVPVAAALRYEVTLEEVSPSYI